jgi:hypothetical protein
MKIGKSYRDSWQTKQVDPKEPRFTRHLVLEHRLAENAHERERSALTSRGRIATRRCDGASAPWLSVVTGATGWHDAPEESREGY